MKLVVLLFALFVRMGIANPIRTIAQTAQQVNSTENVVFLVSTPDMKPSGPVKGDYDRVKLALAQEFNAGLRGFSMEKLAFYLYTFTTDPAKVAEIKKRILKVVPDAKLTQVTESQIQNLK
jgi:hypothetical protein